MEESVPLHIPQCVGEGASGTLWLSCLPHQTGASLRQRSFLHQMRPLAGYELGLSQHTRAGSSSEPFPSDLELPKPSVHLLLSVLHRNRTWSSSSASAGGSQQTHGPAAPNRANTSLNKAAPPRPVLLSS